MNPLQQQNNEQKQIIGKLLDEIYASIEDIEREKLVVDSELKTAKSQLERTKKQKAELEFNIADKQEHHATEVQRYGREIRELKSDTERLGRVKKQVQDEYEELVKKNNVAKGEAKFEMMEISRERDSLEARIAEFEREKIEFQTEKRRFNSIKLQRDSV